MDRREALKVMAAANAAHVAARGGDAVAAPVAERAPNTPVYYDYFRDIPSSMSDLAETYFKPNQDEGQEYDVIVIGSGMGGGILADALSDRGMRTLVLEAGGLRHFVHVGNLPISVAVDCSYPYTTVNGSASYGGASFALGGKSLYWSNVIPRMEDWELQHWPLEIQEFLAKGGYDKAEQLFRKRVTHIEQQEKLKAALAGKLPSFQVTHLPRAFHTPTPASRRGFPDEISTGFFSTAALLTSSRENDGTAGRDNLTINLNHVVTHIETKGDTASAVHCYDPKNDVSRTFRAAKVVLCAGTVESSRIALSSALKDVSGLIGVGPTFHQVAKLEFTVPESFALLSRFDQAKLFVRPLDNSQSRDQYTCELALNWQFWHAKTEDDDLWNQKYGTPQEARSTIKFLFRHSLDNRNFVRLAGRQCEVYVTPMEGEPLKNEISVLKNAVMDFFGASKERDQDVTYFQASDAFWHLGGSLRIGTRGKAVVNADLRFHEYKNLFACDLSVLPDIPAVNPSLTLGALALRLAEHISRSA